MAAIGFYPDQYRDSRIVVQYPESFRDHEGLIRHGGSVSRFVRLINFIA